MKFESKFFWVIHNDLPHELLKGYLSGVKGLPESALSQYLKLVEKKIPIAPKVYLTSQSIKGSEGNWPDAFLRELDFILSQFETVSGRQFGGTQKPLLLTVRGDLCGAIHNVGCSPQTLRAMIHDYGHQTAYGLYISFLESFSTLVLRSPHVDFKAVFNIAADREGGSDALGKLSEDEFLGRVREYQNLISQKIQKPFPDASPRQLLLALTYAARAGKKGGSDEIFVEMQFPRSVDSRSVSGLVYTRDPFSGKKDLYGVYQLGGSHQKIPIEGDGFRSQFPQVYSQIKRCMVDVEECFHDVMEVEFYSDADAHLTFSHFDKAQTTAKATVTNAVELNREGKISDLDAALRIKPKDVEVLLHPILEDSSRASLKDIGSTGVTAAPGTSIGHIFFTMNEAMEFYRTAVKNKTDKRVILIADELLISDTPGLGIIQGLVTRAAGISSHAAVMARANGIPCIVGYKGLEFSNDRTKMIVDGKEVKAGTLITLEAGAEGRLFLGEGKLQNFSFQESIVRDVAQLFDRVVRGQKIPFEVRVNINNAKDAETGLLFGADGVGLCRTENMFMEQEALREIRNIVFTRDMSKCGESLKKLEEFQFNDFTKIFQAMRDRTVNIRLMDLPLHDFVPQNEEGFKELEKQLPHLSKEQIRIAAEELREHNPMLGLRACRFGLINPDVYNMQIRAIVRAAYTVAKQGIEPKPGIMFPLVFTEEELSRLKARVHEIEAVVCEELKIPFGAKIHFKVGSMIELPAAALNSDHLAKIGEFFAFGTNDLTQTTLGMSRDDSAHYLPAYIEKGILASDPFKVLADPVKQLLEISVSRGQRVRKDVSFGICGEQGGDPATLAFCLKRRLNYVSCSPFRVLPTKVALVQIAMQERQKNASENERAA